MPRFDWKKFCIDRRISFISAGPNTAAGNISIHCPFCGASDPSEHMGLSLNLDTPVWGCWRSGEHRGKNPVRLVAKLLGIHWRQALTIVEMQNNNPDEFEAAVEKLKGTAEEPVFPTNPKRLFFPKEFRPFDGVWPRHEGRFVKYLRDRGFSEHPRDAHLVIHYYGLRYCITGSYTNRIIAPVYHGGQLVTWTARAITRAEIRYLTLEREKEVRDIKDCLFMRRTILHTAETEKVLVIVEGPFDMMKVDFYGKKKGVVCAALCGLSITDEQMVLISKISKRFKRVVLLLDETAGVESAIMVSQLKELAGGEIIQGVLPDGVDDPGDLSASQVYQLSERWTEE
jgi:hypothetical protein